MKTYFRVECRTANCSRKGRVFFLPKNPAWSEDDDPTTHIKDWSVSHCGACKNALWPVKLGKWYIKASPDQAVPPRDTSGLDKRRRPVNLKEEMDDDELLLTEKEREEKLNKEIEEEGASFLPAKKHINLIEERVTVHDYTDHAGGTITDSTRKPGFNCSKSLKVLPLQAIGNNGGRTSQQKAMEQHYNGKYGANGADANSITPNAAMLTNHYDATAVVNAYSPNALGGKTRKTSAEWCHCRASCLGGASARSNLFAGSHCCNTFMLIIESWLNQNRNRPKNVLSSFRIEITLYYDDNKKNNRTSSRLAPLYARYQVALDGKSINFYIYCRATGFSMKDVGVVRTQLVDTFKTVMASKDAV